MFSSYFFLRAIPEESNNLYCVFTYYIFVWEWKNRHLEFALFARVLNNSSSLNVVLSVLIKTMVVEKHAVDVYTNLQ